MKLTKAEERKILAERNRGSSSSGKGRGKSSSGSGKKPYLNAEQYEHYKRMVVRGDGSAADKQRCRELAAKSNR